MSKIQRARTTVIIPVHNGATTIRQTIRSLLKQKGRDFDLIVIEDGSKDNSLQLIKEVLRKVSVSYRIIHNQNAKGLARAYNDGIRATSANFIVTLHQDVILNVDALVKLTQPAISDAGVVACGHIVCHPLEVWKNYPFWQKCYFSRLVGKKIGGLDGKFDCFRRQTLERVGLFDETTFFSGGEHQAIVNRLGKLGKVIITKAEIIHVHRMDQEFSIADMLQKQAQYSEAQGALLRHGEVVGIVNFGLTFFRELLVIGLLVPYVQLATVVAIGGYALLYTKLVFLTQYRNPRILLLPLVNIALLFVSLLFSAKGFLYGKQG
ncbi:MAG: hypothetical protein UW69_C0087G0009 [Microgenomates group bacterium GW2011_GWA2_44_7]|nr:MAG: hypothetical protein UW69_C0087G0009 [Microgenomates group bacterium GW2011_GWA2_44_7]KKT78383.1 MAG: hypothetical protein UW73_C0003G0031 [Microgenomates group bacterium GW2011_GWB1_44_8]